MTEWKTLRELDVRPGDVVIHEHHYKAIVEDTSKLTGCFMCDGKGWIWDSPVWAVASRADDTEPYSGDEPILLRDMTAEQIGLLMKASFAGKKIEYFQTSHGLWISAGRSPEWSDHIAYRVLPRPHVEIVELMVHGRVVGTIETKDGKLNPDSVKWGIGNE